MGSGIKDWRKPEDDLKLCGWGRLGHEEHRSKKAPCIPTELMSSSPGKARAKGRREGHSVWLINNESDVLQIASLQAREVR